ncbi:MAG: hypothetical protein NC336_00415 [Clostridium sp.]|nr:hypothetical protein [Clostridium sp.]
MHKIVKSFKRISIVVAVFVTAITMFTRCNYTDSMFVGEVIPVDLANNVREIEGNQINDIPLPYPASAAYDSIFITFSPNSNTEFHFRVYNILSGEELGAFVASGHGENEFYTTTQISSIDVEDGELKTILNVPDERKILVWNITKSLKEGTTVFDEIKPYDNLIGNGEHFNLISMCGENDYVVKIQSTCKFPDNKVTPHYYQILDSETLEEKGRIEIIREVLENKKCEVSFRAFISSNSSANKQNKKIVEAMFWLGQINIIDTKNHEVKSYRVSGTDGSEIYRTSMSEAPTYYTGVTCDSDFIYALWKDKPHNVEAYAEWIHKYDWKGKMVERIHLDKPLTEIRLEESTNTLYGYNPDNDRIYAFAL